MSGRTDRMSCKWCVKRPVINNNTGQHVLQNFS